MAKERNRDEGVEGKKSFRDKMAEILDMPKDFIGDSPMVSMVGDREVMVEGCKGIIEYTTNTIRLNTTKYMIKISGVDMELKAVASEYIHVYGKIAGVEYIL